ncbi:hypothetical protein BKA66DRAFT_418804, partial [Pyrenochaeta sp. MPI-SDFR-AT-0127]
PVIVIIGRDVSPTEHQNRHISMNHALTDRAVSFFCARLRYARATGGTLFGSTIRFLASTLATTIPFACLMNLHPSFSIESLKGFSKCHLLAMTDLSFFVYTKRTGWFSIAGWHRTVVDEVGGKYHNAFADTLPEYFPNGRAFEGVVCFSLVHDIEVGLKKTHYKLQSNNVRSEADFHNLPTRVERKTDQFIIDYWHPL